MQIDISTGLHCTPRSISELLMVFVPRSINAAFQYESGPENAPSSNALERMDADRAYNPINRKSLACDTAVLTRTA